jgi:hypothetical protein
LKDRVFRPARDGAPASGRSSWFALRTDDPKALAVQIGDAKASDVRERFVRGDFEKWLRDLYGRPDLADAVKDLREHWSGHHIPRRELIQLIESRRPRTS